MFGFVVITGIFMLIISAILFNYKRQARHDSLTAYRPEPKLQAYWPVVKVEGSSQKETDTIGHTKTAA